MIRLLVDTASDISINNDENIKVITPDKFFIERGANIPEVVRDMPIVMPFKEFYEMLTSTSEFPKTSQPAPQMYVEAFEEAKKAGDTLLCILLSSGVSGTYQSAVLANEIVEYDNIYIIDSLTGAYGIKILVDEALKLIKEETEIEKIVEQLEELKSRIRIYLSVDTLDYLYRGGRLDKKSAVIGNVVKIKPIITVTKEGVIGVVGKAMGMVRAMMSMTDIVLEEGVDTDYNFYTICTSGTTNVEKLEKRLENNGIRVTERDHLGPVVGTHVGPEGFGVIFIAKK